MKLHWNDQIPVNFCWNGIFQYNNPLHIAAALEKNVVYAETDSCYCFIHKDCVGMKVNIKNTTNKK